jgi:hypothetical protein
MATSHDTVYVTGTREYVAGAPHEGQVEAYPLDGCGGPECAAEWSAPLEVVVPSMEPFEFGHLRPVVAGDVVYALDARGVLAVGADGTDLALLPLDAPPIRMSVSAGHVFAVSNRDGEAALTAFGLP